MEHEDTEGWPYTREMGEKWVSFEKGDSLRVEGMKLHGEPCTMREIQDSGKLQLRRLDIDTGLLPYIFSTFI